MYFLKRGLWLCQDKEGAHPCPVQTSCPFACYSLQSVGRDCKAHEGVAIEPRQVLVSQHVCVSNTFRGSRGWPKRLLATRAHRGTGWFGSGAIRAATGRRWLLTFVCLIHGRHFRFLHLTHLITSLDRRAGVVHFQLAAYQEEPRSSANSAAGFL